MRTVIAFILAIVVATLAGTIASTQDVIARLAELGAPVTLLDRFVMTAHDFVGMGPAYGAVIALAFLIAFTVAWLVIRVAPPLRLIGYVLAGAAAVAIALQAMIAVFGTVPIAGARDIYGFSAMVAGGALAGLAFALVSARRAAD